MNIENILNLGKNILKSNNIPSPNLDSEILMCESIKKEKNILF